jgi:hypothetical protein
MLVFTSVEPQDEIVWESLHQMVNTLRHDMYIYILAEAGTT